MSHSNKKTPALLLTVLALSVGLSACNKSKNTAESTTATSSTSSTTTTVVEATSTTDMTALPASATDGMMVASGVGVTSATSATAITTSATALTALQMANVGSPKDSVKNFLEALRVGRVTYAMGLLQATDKATKPTLIQSIPMYKDIKSIKYAEPQYNDDKTQAVVIALITNKSSKVPVQLPYAVEKTMTGWKVLGQFLPQTTSPAPIPTTMPSGSIKGNNAQNIPAFKPRTKDVLVAKTTAGTPEDAFKKAMNAMVKLPASEAAKYYLNTQPTATLTAQQAIQQAQLQASQQADNAKNSKAKKGTAKTQPALPPMPTLEEKVAMQQALFQQALQSVKLGKTQYNKDKTEATVNAVFTPFPQTGSKPQDMAIKMKKDSTGAWKIISE